MANLAAIRGCVDRAVQLGELSPERDAAALAVALNGFLVGISAQARDRVDCVTLQASIAEIMSLWPPASNDERRTPQAGLGNPPSKVSSAKRQRELGSSRARKGSGSSAGSHL